MSELQGNMESPELYGDMKLVQELPDDGHAAWELEASSGSGSKRLSPASSSAWMRSPMSPKSPKLPGLSPVSSPVFDDSGDSPRGFGPKMAGTSI